jgi:hypothetical protein
LHLNDPDLRLDSGLKFHINNLNVTTPGDLDWQRIERTWRWTIEDFARCIIDTEMTRTEKHLP